jgi:hypothetical protein
VVDDTNYDHTTHLFLPTVLFSGNSRYYELRTAQRFILSVPPGATVSNAYFTIEASSSHSASVTLRIVAVKSLDVPAFTHNTREIKGYTRTTASVSWSPGSWSDGRTYNSTNFATVIQELVSQAGWQSGNEIVIITERNTIGSSVSSSDAGRRRGTLSPLPKLTVDYLAGVPSLYTHSHCLIVSQQLLQRWPPH